MAQNANSHPAINLTSDWVWGVEYVRPIFICENNRKSIKNMHYFDIFMILVDLKIWAFFSNFNLVRMKGGRGVYVPIADRMIANSSFQGLASNSVVRQKIFWGNSVFCFVLPLTP